MKSRKNQLRIVLIIPGIIFIILSYLCFINLIQIETFKICGSQCEYWWSWVINYPPQPLCILLCVPRNGLYKPLMVIGVIIIAIEVFFEIGVITRKIVGKKKGIRD